jgi:hypothetical protein
VTAYEIAIIYTWLDDFDNAFRWLARLSASMRLALRLCASIRTSRNSVSIHVFADLMRETEKTIP